MPDWDLRWLRPHRDCRRACCFSPGLKRICGRNSPACPIAVAWRPCAGNTSRRAAKCGRWTPFASKYCTTATTSFTRRRATGALATISPADFIASGTIGNGHFALFLSEIVGDGRLSYEYKGEEVLLGRRLAHYEYSVPVNQSGHTINFTEGSGTVGMKGSFWADPATYDIVRISMEAVGYSAGVARAESSATSIDYSHTNLAGSDFLLPQVRRFPPGEILRRREPQSYRVHPLPTVRRAELDFVRPQPGFPLFGASSVLEVKRELLPALQIVVKISLADHGEDSVGALIEGRWRATSYAKEKSADSGSVRAVRGRVRRLEWNEEKGGYIVVALEFTEIEAAGTRYRFFADLQDTGRVPGVHRELRFDKRETAPSVGRRDHGRFHRDPHLLRFRAWAASSCRPVAWICRPDSA